MRKQQKAQHTCSFPDKLWHSDSHILFQHWGCVRTKHVGADYINLHEPSSVRLSDVSVHLQDSCSVVCWKCQEDFGWKYTNIEAFRGKRRQMLTFDSRGVIVLGGPGIAKQTEARPQSGLMMIISYLFISSYLLRTQGRGNDNKQQDCRRVCRSKLQWLESDMFWLKQPGRITG